MNRNKIFILISAVFYTLSSVSAQIDEFWYKRELTGISGQWHKIALPDDIYDKTSHYLSGMRIYGITTSGDTIEAPYVLQSTESTATEKEVIFKLINTSNNSKGFYFTFEITASNIINCVNLDFEQKNFDWRLKIEGSDNRRDWFTIVDDYRIVAINNDETSYNFTTVSFPDSKYRYLRFFIPSDEAPVLNKASILFKESINGEYRTFPYKLNYSIVEYGDNKIDIDMGRWVPINYIKINVNDTIDYYRNVSVDYIIDSAKVSNKWIFHNSYLTSGIISSFEENILSFRSVLAKRLTIEINNNDNKPLTVNSIEIKGNIPDMAARFPKQGQYFLVYGNPEMGVPEYDLEQFRDKIPEDLTALTLGEEQIQKTANQFIDKSLLKSKLWLWAVMIVIIALLGWSSVKMIVKTKIED